MDFATLATVCALAAWAIDRISTARIARKGA